MALFGSKKKTPSSAEAPAGKEAAAVSSHVSMQDLSHILRHTRVTEKATMHSSESVYVFDVAMRSTKHQIAAAVRKLYSVTPRMIRVAAVPSKMKRSARTGKIGIKKGGKKAYVYLNKGDTINL